MDILKKGYWLIATALSAVYDFTGSKHIYEYKIKKQPRTIFLWVVGIYIALYGMTSARYEFSLDRLENKMNAIITQLSTTNKQAFNNLISQLCIVQKRPTPTKPNFWNPFSTFTSLFIEEKNQDISMWVRETFAIWKNNLAGIQLPFFTDLRAFQLNSANLEGAILVGVNIEEGDLSSANLENANLMLSNFKRADLKGVYLERAVLCGTDFREACLRGANLKEAILDKDTNFEGADLRDANLKGMFWGSIKKFNILSKVRNPGGLYGIKGLDPELEKELREKKPALFEDIDEFIIYRDDYIYAPYGNFDDSMPAPN